MFLFKESNGSLWNFSCKSYAGIMTLFPSVDYKGFFCLWWLFLWILAVQLTVKNLWWSMIYSWTSAPTLKTWLFFSSELLWKSLGKRRTVWHFHFKSEQEIRGTRKLEKYQNICTKLKLNLEQNQVYAFFFFN